MVRPDRRSEDLDLDARYEQLVQYAPDGIIIHDGERIIAANESALRLVGATSRNELIGQPVSLVLDPPYLRAAAQALGDDRQPSGYSDPVRDIVRRLDGTTVDVEVRAVVFLYRGKPAAHLVIRDITDRLALEEATRKVEARMQQAERAEAIGALAGGVAHELNNMIAVIAGHASFIIDGKASPAMNVADAREIAAAAERAAGVTRQLLAFSRHAVNRPEPIDLDELLAETDAAVRRLLASTRSLTIKPGSTAAVCVDRNQLAQVIMILVSNARDATPIGGSITLETGTVDLPDARPAAGASLIPPGHYATLSVSDDGAGIEPAMQSRIFEPFFTTKQEGQGSGLGLAAAQGILAQHHGFLAVESQPGAGSTFRAYLPTIGPRAATPAKGTPVLSTGARRTVLVVDDEPAIRAVAARVLGHAGFEVTQAADGVDALKKVERLGPPSLVLTDLRMPRMDGLDLLKRLRERWPGLPVLLMSGYSAEFLKLDGAIARLDEIIQKPFTPEHLRARVESAIAITEAAGTSPSA